MLAVSKVISIEATHVAETFRDVLKFPIPGLDQDKYSSKLVQ